MLKITDPARVKQLSDLLRCSLCKRVFVEATTINVCLHTFCKECIYRKFEEDGAKSCPVCNQELGSNSNEYLRPDENLRSIVKKITFGKTKKKAAEVKNQVGDSSIGECDDDKSEEKAGKLPPTSSQESTTKLPVAFNAMEEPFKMPEFSLKISEPPKADIELKAPTKKKRNTNRKARQYNTVESKGKQKIENSIGNEDAAPEDKAPPLWFSLHPAEDKNANGFPKLVKPSLRIKDYSTTVSTFQKYLQQKLNLEDESEVEISCCGKKLNPTMNLDDIKKLWLECTLPKGSKKVRAKWTVEQLSIELAYSRRMV